MPHSNKKKKNPVKEKNKIISTSFHEAQGLAYQIIRKKIKRTFGYVFPSSITNLFKEKGYEATSYSGNLHTLKHELTKANPVIVLINIKNDANYAVVVGYDQKNIYLVDFLK